jgi:molecular chaperone HscB
MPADFLTRQLELREALEEAEAKKDPAALKRLRDGLRVEREALKNALGEQLDARRDYPAAAGLVRKLMFLDRLDAELDAAFETMDD